MNKCPLCSSNSNVVFYRDSRRHYKRCFNCWLVFVPDQFHLNHTDEQAEYDKHENDPQDAGYVNFLSRLVVPLQARLQEGARGLDFGCGPGPAVASMMRANGYNVKNYDPIYANKPIFLSEQFDFVIATEVIEHFRNPAVSLAQVWQCVKPGGHFGAMSKLVISQEAFANWHYKNDPTHVAFFSRETLQWVASRWNATLVFFAADAFVFIKGC
ncbi:class I SAM-dependent methyltransferase [Teredinibacter turnerae]|uniref:class I SAM-dependent methyltransferase n=1 Tax=Teredinibacter turnerae TaxID=2426 RepID=UPI0030D59F30